MTNYKTLLILCLLFSLANFSYSQNAPNDLNEVRLNYGMASMEQFAILILTSIAGTTIGGIYNENVKDINGTFIGPVMLQYQRSFKNSRFTVGGLFAYSKANTDVVYESKPELTFKFDISYFIIMAQSEYKYIDNKNFQLYSGLGLGVDIISPSGNDTKGNSAPSEIGPALHLTPVGLKFGSEKFGGNLELGWGSKGLVSGGVYARF
jgi:hypothetical protein